LGGESKFILNEELATKLDDTLSSWRQGDAVIATGIEFVHLANLSNPLTPESADALGEEASRIEGILTQVEGLIILSQTCDVVRSCKSKPFLEVAPLVAVRADRFNQVRLGQIVSLAYVPGIADMFLAADLSRVMTIEKAVLAGGQRIPGCLSDPDKRNFADAITRVRGRFAFPKDFVDAIDLFRRWVLKTHGKDSEDGRMLDDLREIRVRAAPSWSSSHPELTFLFVKKDDSDFEEAKWAAKAEEWRNKMDFAGSRFQEIDVVVATLDDLTARDMVESDRLDLDHLSLGGTNELGPAST
jgi:hypothetical protein